MAQKSYYLDYASTMPITAGVYKKMLETVATVQGNSASMHEYGRKAEKELQEARVKVAEAIGANPEEIYFTSGGTESNNWAIKGIARANKSKGKHIITSAVEHSSVLESCRELEEEGFKVTYVPVDEFGVVDYASIIKSIGPDTILISIMMANNEVGSLQPIRAIAELAKQNEVYFHTDAIGAVGSLAINVKELGVDALSISSHKISGPKGVGALYIKNGTEIAKYMSGGRQEMGLRAGTVNVPAIAGFGEAIKSATTDLENQVREVRVVRKYFQKKISEAIHNIALNGHPTQRLANNCSIMFEGAESEAVVMMLDHEGIYASSGSECIYGTNASSHVLRAMGKELEWSRSTVRFSFGPDITKEEIDEIVETIRKVVKKIRSMSAVRIYKNKVEL
ncbi:MAG: cysteine desulfurase [Clostridia bacterium]|nr:cysteine desulfurase [Clostridia bacterium]MBR2391494.1 cysteine desulfurase [Clostridia bacterium]